MKGQFKVSGTEVITVTNSPGTDKVRTNLEVSDLKVLNNN